MDSRYRLVDKARVRCEKSGGFLAAPGGGKIYVLNATALSIIEFLSKPELADGGASASSIAESLGQMFSDREHDSLQQDILEFLSELSRRGLVTEAK